MKKVIKRLIAIIGIAAIIGAAIPVQNAQQVKAQASEPETDDNKKVITNCDVKEKFTVGDTTYTTSASLNDNTDYIKEGTGSFKYSGDAQFMYQIYLQEPVDIRGYKYLSMQLHITGVEELQAKSTLLYIALTEQYGSRSKCSMRFNLSTATLNEGWNEITLPFAQANEIRNGTDNGQYTGSSVKYVCIWRNGTTVDSTTTYGNVTTYLDDVCARNENPGILIADCDQAKAPGATLLTGTLENEYDRYNVENAYASIMSNTNSSITTVAFMEGTGALKAKCFYHSSSSTYRMQTSVTLSNAATLDLSECVDTDVLHLWLYIGNWSYLQGNITIDLTSYGDAIDNGVTWTIEKDDLQTGWNEIVKPLSSGTKLKTNPIDWSNVNYIRVYTTKGATADTYQKEDAYMLLDDIRVAEKEVFAQRKERGTATVAGTAEPTLDGYEFGGYYEQYDSETQEFSSPLRTTREATPESPVYVRWVPKEVMAVKAQVRQNEYNDCKKVLTSCDSLDEASNLDASKMTGSVSKARVREGEASLYKKATINKRNSEGNVPSTTLYNIYLNTAVDVSGYKYFSCQLYLSNLDDLNASGSALGIVINSVQGESNTNALHFYLEKDELKVGWNDLKLSFALADKIANSSTDNRYDGKAVNYIRILQYGNANRDEGTLITYLDDICVLNDNSGVVIADCDQMSAPKATAANSDNSFATIVQNGNANSIDKENKAEGEGAFKAAAYSASTTKHLIQAPIVLSDANRVDISNYKDIGYLQFMLYINDKTNWTDKKITVELRSNGNKDDAEIYWQVSVNDLQAGSWNVVRLPLAEQDATTQPQGYTSYKAAENGTDFEWDRVNCFRIFLNPVAEDDVTSQNYILIDDIRVVDSVQIATCDSTDELFVSAEVPQVVKQDDVIQGTGAAVYEANTGKVQHQFKLKNPVNFEGFVNTRGCLHFWYYIEDPAYLGDDNLKVELSSKTADWDSHDKEYIIKRERLVKGWNEIYLYLNDDTDSSIGDMDWKSIQHIRIYCGTAFKQACTTKVDDLSLVPGNKETVDVRFISTVESTGYRKAGFEITQSRSGTPLVTETTNVYEALYAVGEDGVRDSITPVDISGTTESVYMQTATVINIPNRLWDATFTIVPYWVTQDGTTVWGEAKTYTMNQICSSGPKLLSMDYDTGMELDDYNRDLYGMNAYSDKSDIMGSDPGVFYISKDEDAEYGGWYYMYLSGSRGTDGVTDYTGLEDVKVRVMRSKDLYNWQDCGAIGGYSLLLYEDDWVDTECSAFWAPEVIRHPTTGKYYMYFTAIAKIGHIDGVSEEGTNDTSVEDYMDRMFLGVAESESPIGPFEMIYDTQTSDGKRIPTMNFQKQYDTPEFIRALDATPFFDGEDFYLYFVRHQGQYNDGNRICGVKMDDMVHATNGTFTYLTQPNYTTVNYVKGEPSKWVEEVQEDARAAAKEDATAAADKASWSELLLAGGKDKWIASKTESLLESKVELKVAEKFVEGCEPSDMQDVTINEGPAIVKRDGRYYLTYSEDRYRSKNYSVHLAVSDDPLEGFTKLSSAEGGQVCYGALDDDLYGTGHHSLVENTDTGEWWIVYHRHATNGKYEVNENGNELYDTSTGRYISVDRVNWINNTLGYEVPSTNGPLRALNWLPESVSGYKNLAETATITVSGATGQEYLNDGILPFYSSVADKTCVSDGNDLEITMRWDAPVSISSLMVYNAHDVNAAFSKISDITFRLAKKLEWTTRAYEYVRMTDIAFPERYWDAQTGAYVNCAPIVAEFDEITVTELTLTIRAEDYLLVENQADAFNISEIVVLGRNK